MHTHTEEGKPATKFFNNCCLSENNIIMVCILNNASFGVSKDRFYIFYLFFERLLFVSERHCLKAFAALKNSRLSLSFNSGEILGVWLYIVAKAT